MQKLTNDRSQYVQTAINEANERKKELFLEIGSSRFSRSSRNSKASSITARALAKAEATAALKKLQMQKWRSVRESKAALDIQQQELALAKKKMEEKARMESLRLEEEAAVALAKAQAIERELGLEEHLDYEKPDLPQDNPLERVQHYVASQVFTDPNTVSSPPDVSHRPNIVSPPPDVSHRPNTLNSPPDVSDSTNDVNSPSGVSNHPSIVNSPPDVSGHPNINLHPPGKSHHPNVHLSYAPDRPYHVPRLQSTDDVIDAVHEELPKRTLDPLVGAFVPRPTNICTDPNANVMSSYIQFMSRREVIANKIQKFDDNPKNFCSWRETFKNMIRGISITPLSKCRAFLAKPLEEKTRILRQNRVCFHCIASCDHFAKNCKTKVECSICKSDKHLVALHVDAGVKDGGEPRNKLQPERQASPQNEQSDEITTKCTEVCGTVTGGKSCSKICLANVYVRGRPETKVETYVVIDDQSNSSLAKPELFDRLNINGKTTTYSLKTCAGTSQIEGRSSHDIVVESLDGKVNLLSSVFECAAIPDSKEEIPTPEVAKAHPHLREISREIPELREDVDVLLLVGRNAPPLQKIHESRNGPRNAPWAQRLDLGWVIIGNACLDGVHKPTLSCYRTTVLDTGRPTTFSPCPNRLFLKEDPPSTSERLHENNDNRRKEKFEEGEFDDGIGTKVFSTTKHDNKPGQSQEDQRFVSIMDKEMVQNAAGNWEAPLPFRNPISQLPGNREDAWRRFNSTRRTLDRKPDMKGHYFEFMGKLLNNGHAEKAPLEEEDSGTPRWYLPHFGVYHPRKPGKIRVVFDSAAETNGVSLNKLLLSGPDMTNSLLGILLRFRTGQVAFMSDIEQMFHSFVVREDHRDFLRFFWYKDNNPNNEVIEYRMTVHVFGNTSSPAVATYGLRKTATIGELQHGHDAREFVEKDFYVDDGLKSVSNDEEAIDLLRRTQSMLANANLRLHKIACSSPAVTQAFAAEDRASDLRNLDLHKDVIPIQRSLGVFWNLQTDSFTFEVTEEVKPFTRRGVLSVTNSLYDPLGIAAPVTIKAKMMLRLMTENLKRHPLDGWDKPLPEKFRPAWEAWRKDLLELTKVKVRRVYASGPLSAASRLEIHTFCDASIEAIAAVSYLRVVHRNGLVQISFLLGKAKLSPNHATTIPRLELCAAVLGVEITETILEELAFTPHSVTCYTDSKVTLGYILNETRRFYIYVANRVRIIRKSSSPDQWRYVATDRNPADLATRSVKACDLESSEWLTGPQFLQVKSPPDVQLELPIPDLAAENPEIRPEIKTLSTHAKPEVKGNLGASRFLRFSRWSSLVKGLAKLVSLARKQNRRHPPAIEPPSKESKIEAQERAKVIILKNAQHEAFPEEIDCLKKKGKISKSSPLFKLCPILDSEGRLRVGGRLERSNLPYDERHPLILSGTHHVTRLIVEHYHEKVKHQGRHFTHGAIREKGFWIVGGKRLISRVIHHCLKCKKLRGKFQFQKMADLPIDRLTPSPPFTFVGLDVFGPWEVMARRTRGGQAHNKRWAVIFTCLSTRAIHIELIESMDTSSLINALRRFVAIRGPVLQFRSDCGTNFVGACNELKAATSEMDKENA